MIYGSNPAVSLCLNYGASHPAAPGSNPGSVEIFSALLKFDPGSVEIFSALLKFVLDCSVRGQ